MKREDVKRDKTAAPRLRWRRLLVLAFITFHVSRFTTSRAIAAPTQEEVFKSIQDNVGERTDFKRALPFLMAGGAVVILLALFGQRRKREFTPKALNHQGKLLKEVMKSLPLRPAELRQLKVLAEAVPGIDEPLASPLTLLLCPSLLAKSLQARQGKAGKVDRKILAHVATKAGVPRG